MNTVSGYAVSHTPDVCLPRLFEFGLAARTTARAGRLPYRLRQFARVAFTAFERYALLRADVLVAGADPFLVMLAAYRSAAAGRNVVVYLSNEIDCFDDRYNDALRRGAMMTDGGLDLVTRRIPELAAPSEGPVAFFQRTSEALAALVLPEGAPRVRVYVGSPLYPDSGTLRRNGGPMLFWPSGSSAVPARPVPREVAALQAWLRTTLCPVTLPRPTTRITCAIEAEHLVLVNRLVGFQVLAQAARVTRIGEAAQPLSWNYRFGPLERMQDIQSVLDAHQGTAP